MAVDPQDSTRPMTATEARAALDQAEAATPVTRQDRAHLESGLIGVSVAMGLVLLLVRATVGNPEVSAAVRGIGFGVGMALYVVAVSIFAIRMQRAKAAPRGFAVRYGWGLGITSLVYAIFVTLISTSGGNGDPWPWVLTVAAALVTMTPGLLAAHSSSKLDAR